MKEEIEHACRWWVQQLKQSKELPASLQSAAADTSDDSVFVLFERALALLLVSKYTDHWYEDDVARGSAYRSISYDSRLDTLLRKAARSAGIEDVEKLLTHVRHTIMFVNPGEVKIQNVAFDSCPPPDFIYQKHVQASSPASDSPTSSPKPSRSYSQQYTPSRLVHQPGDRAISPPLASPLVSSPPSSSSSSPASSRHSSPARRSPALSPAAKAFEPASPSQPSRSQTTSPAPSSPTPSGRSASASLSKPVIKPTRQHSAISRNSSSSSLASSSSASVSRMSAIPSMGSYGYALSQPSSGMLYGSTMGYPYYPQQQLRSMAPYPTYGYTGYPQSTLIR